MPGVVDDADICLLSEVKAAFKGAGVSRLSAREAAVKAMLAHLYPKPVAKGEDMAALSKDFLKLAQGGMLIEVRPEPLLSGLLLTGVVARLRSPELLHYIHIH